MFLYPYRRSRRWQRAGRLSIYVAAFIILLDVFRMLGAHRTFSNNLISQTIYHVEDLPHEAANQKIYIAAQFWTSEYALVTFWLTQFLKVVETLGPENIYVSILESGSLDNTADAIRWLDAELGKMGVSRTMVIDPTTHEDLVNSGSVDDKGHEKTGWIKTGHSTPPGQKEIRRIPYLSDLRNQGLEPLQEIHMRNGKTFDKILFLNDVYFEPSDILTLLATNGGHYDVACGIDYSHPPAFYDTFALRDSNGDEPVMATFPYFGSGETRASILKGAPTRVMSCWNGIIAVDAAPYYDQIESKRGESKEITPGLRFRGLSDSLALHHLEASECCLIHADLLAADQAHKGIYLNPAVRTGYNIEAYEKTHRGAEKGFVNAWQYATGIWKNKAMRFKIGLINTVAGREMAKVHKRMMKWQSEGKQVGEERSEVGDYCIVDEMHILIWNGWKHVW